MRALTVEPCKARSAKLEDVKEPGREPGAVTLEMLCVGMCGTDGEIISGHYGRAPPGRSRLILGHESVGRVVSGSDGFEPGALVVPIVRRPDPVPCASCAVGEWDMCRNGRYTEHGIKELDGFCVERVQENPRFLVRIADGLESLGVLLEPTSVVAKAWQQIERIGHRTHWSPCHVVVTGAGPIGLLAALIGRQKGFDVHVFDREKSGPKPALVQALGADYHTENLTGLLNSLPADIVIDCTGASPVVLDVVTANARGAITCLVGVSAAGRTLPVDIGGLNRNIVLENDVVFGSVNANRTHYEEAARVLENADRAWLGQLISRRVPL